MLCPVTINTKTGVSSPNDLVGQAYNASAIDLKITNEDGEEVPIYFVENRETIDTNRLTQDSTSTLISLCHFKGKFDGSLSAVSLCDPKSINGLIVIKNNYFVLEVRNEKFVLLPQTTNSCKFFARSKRAPQSNRLPSYYRDFNDGKTRYVELALMADYSMFEKYDKDERKVNDRLQSIANAVNSLYFPLNVKISLVYTEVWKDGDKFAVATSGDKTLEHFLAYRKTILKEHPNDNAHMLTNIRFEQGVVGKAYKGTMCSYDYSGGVDVDHNSNPAAVAATVAHEMGHNFGMEHDVDYDSTCKCPNPTKHCIMAPATGDPPPALWSDCSLKYISRGFSRGMDLCLKNQPEVSSGGKAKCGNGIVEKGEECDCGGTCLNNCCDGATCKLIGEAECAEGECCDLATCKPKPRATQCRAALNICDLPEFCNGKTTDCPADFFVQDGHVCPGRQDEFCYQGICGSKNDQCLEIWGPNSKSSIDQCFNQNAYGTIYGNCGFDPHTNNFTKCEHEDIMCGRLHCETLGERPIYGDPSTVQPIFTKYRTNDREHQCNSIKTTFTISKERNDPGMVNSGAKCGKDKICVDSKCQEWKNVNKTVSQCNDNCHWRGVCNNVGNCHCDNGFGGVACEIPGYGGSVNSNTSNLHRGITPSVVFLVLFGLFGILFVVTCIYYRVKRNRNLLNEIWVYSKKSLNLHGTLVPTRKAPAPPSGQRPKRMSFTAMWGDSQVSYSATARNQPQTQTYVPPTIPMMSLDSPSPPAETIAPPVAVKTNSLSRPKDPPPMVPVRPHPMALAKIYDDQFADLAPDKPLPPTPKEIEYPMPSKGIKVSRADSMRPANPPPPPPPSSSKPGKPGSAPPLPKGGPGVKEETAKLDVKKMAALFDSKRKPAK